VRVCPVLSLTSGNHPEGEAEALDGMPTDPHQLRGTHLKELCIQLADVHPGEVKLGQGFYWYVKNITVRETPVKLSPRKTPNWSPSSERPPANNKRSRLRSIVGKPGCRW